MRFLLLLSTVLAIVSVGTGWRTLMRGRSRYGNLKKPALSSEKYTLPEERWFSQYVDHFNPTNTDVWKQKYYVNSAFYKPNGPIFLMIGGADSADPEWMVEGQWIEYAKEFGAMCFYLEHRYYGKSQLTPDLMDNPIFLSSEIALADVAYFIQSINTEYKFSNDTKWIAFGGSYGGSLAAWMRVKYTHLVHGAVSTSGPLQAQVDFQDYYVVVANALRQFSQKCEDTVAEANERLHVALNHVEGQKKIEKIFKLCDPFGSGMDVKLDIANLYETIASNFAEIVQYNEDNRDSSPTSTITIEKVCNLMMDESLGEPIDRLGYVSNVLLAASKEKCLDYRYDKMIYELRNISWASERVIEGDRQWMYQTCMEFGFFQTSNARSKLFGDTFPVDFFVKQCMDIFGPGYNRNVVETVVRRTNILYGGLNLKVSNVVFVHGSLDPWHSLGITQSSNPQAPAIFIDGTAHCANMYPSSEHDSPALKNARRQIRDLIEKWLKN